MEKGNKYPLCMLRHNWVLLKTGISFEFSVLACSRCKKDKKLYKERVITFSTYCAEFMKQVFLLDVLEPVFLEIGLKGEKKLLP